MKNISVIFVILAAILICGSCRNNSKTENNQAATVQQNSIMPDEAKSAEKVVIPGEDIFKKNCLACHQSDGSGVPEMYPPLSNSEIVKGPPEGIIKAILFGLKGPAVVDGNTYLQPMPPMGNLNDSAIAVLVTYVKKRWGGEDVSITAMDVNKIRNAAGK